MDRCWVDGLNNNQFLSETLSGAHSENKEPRPTSPGFIFNCGKRACDRLLHQQEFLDGDPARCFESGVVNPAGKRGTVPVNAVSTGVLYTVYEHSDFTPQLVVYLHRNRTLMVDDVLDLRHRVEWI